MVVLDTDHVSLLEWTNNPDRRRLRARLDELRPDEVATTIISYEEQSRGWLAYVAKTRSMAEQIRAYGKLKAHLDTYLSIMVLDFNDSAAVEYQRLREARLRVGTMDLKIAAIVIIHDATLLTRNLADFRKVPNLKFEDWTT